MSALGALLAAIAAVPAAAQATPLFPGTTYERSVQFTPHGPVSIHVVRGPRPVGLYRLKPVLSNESIVQRETVSAMQRRLSTQATSVGVNGDYFAPADGRPTGIFLRDGVLATPPNSARSSAGVTLDGLLDVRRVTFRGTWRGTGQRRVAELPEQVAGDERHLALHVRLGLVDPAHRGRIHRGARRLPVGDARTRTSSCRS